MATEEQGSGKDKKTYNEHEISEELVRKVDAYMDSSIPDPAPSAKPADKAPSGASIQSGTPLLPTEKLPDLNKVVAAPKKPQAEPTQTPATAPPLSQPLAPAPPKAGTPTPVATEPVASQPPGKIITPQKASVPPPPADELGLEDPKTNKAVDEIVAAEADQVLAAEDRKQSPPAPVARLSFGQRVKRFFSAWWRSKRYRNATIAGFLLITAVALAIPTSRYFVLNSVGVRASMSLTVLDEKTGQPLKNVEVSLSQAAQKTDDNGKVKLEHLKLGEHNMSIKRVAFAEINRKVTVGWGSNPQGNIELTPVGRQYSFLVTDFLSDKPIKKAEAINGEASAFANEKGEVILTVPETDEGDVEVSVVADNYRAETLVMPGDQKDQQKIQLVPATKHVFISKRKGTYDVYKVDVDGKNEEKVLAGTGSEREEGMALTVHPSKDLAALVSTREGARNQDKYLLSTLTLIDLAKNTTTTITQSERIQLIDWVGDRLVYVKIAQGASEASTDRHRLISYDLGSGTEKELYSTNYFNDVLSVRGAIYYTPAAYMVNGSVGLYKINPDGTNKRTVFEREVWNLLRTDYDKVSVSVGQEWYELDVNNDSMRELNSAPPVLKSRIYADNKEGSESIWVDERDGKGALIAYKIQEEEERVAISQSGLNNPLRWISGSHVIYRVKNGQETADYVLNLSGGEPRKIKDVTNVAGIDRWYYY